MSFFSGSITSANLGDYCHRCRNYSPLCSCLAQMDLSKHYNDYLTNAMNQINEAALRANVESVMRGSANSAPSNKPNKLLLLLR